MFAFDPSKSKILTIVAHPDDELLGMGGSLAKWSKQGAHLESLILAEGLTSRDSESQKTSSDELSNLQKQAIEANKVVGVSKVHFAGFPDNSMDSIALLDVVKTVEKHIEAIQPDIVVTHHSTDLNVDHRICQQAVLTACRPLEGCSVKAVLFAETLSSTEWQFASNSPGFKPNVFVDISETLDKKIEALKHYTSEMREWPHPRSFKAITSLAEFRGSTISAAAAEAFELGRLQL